MGDLRMDGWMDGWMDRWGMDSAGWRLLSDEDHPKGGASSILPQNHRPQRRTWERSMAYMASPPQSPNWIEEVDLVQTASAVKEQFQLFDDQATGTIGKDDLRRVIESLEQFAPEEIDRILKVANTSGGDISYETFIDWAFNSAKALEHRKNRLRQVKLFQNFGELEIEECAKVLELTNFSAGEEIIREGEEGFDCFIVDTGECYASIEINGERKEVLKYEPGGFFGERALLRKEGRAATVSARSDVKLLKLSAEEFVSMIEERDHKENLIRHIKEFDILTDAQVALLAGALERRWFDQADALIYGQVEESNNFYILEEGDCVATIQLEDGQEIEAKQYTQGQIFGEQALRSGGPRQSSVTTVDTVKVLMLSREEFERKLGRWSDLKAAAEEADPRRLMADFYRLGDSRGPRGSLAGEEPDPKEATRWFAVYRPCSSDSIRKMYGKVGVGKGLNVKGKSAKKNRLSGFVPFIQISDNNHKKEVEDAPRDARTKIFFRNKLAREQAEKSLDKVLKEASLKIDDPSVKVISDYEPQSWGLDVPEPLMKEAYIMRPELSPMVGWETGRQSEPAFMDMNLHSTRGNSTPVVSDFDTFLVGSHGMEYSPLPPEQKELMQWCLDHTADIIGMPQRKAWTARWLEVLKEEASTKGKTVEIPKLGFGDPTSVRLIGEVVQVTSSCGAIRHGAECFNFYFPQELDDDFMVVWDGFVDPPWRQLKEPELRKFLKERAREGYCFPLNPVWPIRDKGWYEVLETLRKGPEQPELRELNQRCLEGWFTKEALARIDEIHGDFPECFTQSKMKRMASTIANIQDVTGEEMVDFANEEVRKVVKARWKRVRSSLMLMARMMKSLPEEDHAKVLGNET
ncbi:unnamed protein product [Durusdinium trenchii]|uniref:cGMP-dependent protein kinase n=1 Tax=Durusdinium trenchii TaxID=1381693 RepID=A0ABP0J1S1_9DINO